MRNLAISHLREPVYNLPGEERSYRRGDFDMRMVINRSHGVMRVMDYRAGNYDNKRAMLDDVARAEGLRKIFTVVEKQDSNSWRSAGFVREGVYPSFFRTADAYMMSRVYLDNGQPAAIEALKQSPKELTRFPARRLRKPDSLTLTSIDDEATRAKLLNQAESYLNTLPFSRVRPPDLVIQSKARGGKRAYACAEADESFAHSIIGFSPTPRDEVPMILCAYAGNALINELIARDVANVFGITPVEDRWANELYVGLGFKVTGRLVGHLKTDDGMANALLWHRRLAAEPKHRNQQ